MEKDRKRGTGNGPNNPHVGRNKAAISNFSSGLGGPPSGLYCRLKSPLQDWQNNMIGGVDLTETGNRVLFRASGGPRTVLAGETMSFSFGCCLHR